MFKEDVQNYFNNQTDLITNPYKLEKELKSILDILDCNNANIVPLEYVIAFKKNFIKSKNYIITLNYYYSYKYSVNLFMIKDLIKTSKGTQLILLDDSKSEAQVEVDAIPHIKKMIELRNKCIEKGHQYAYGNGEEKNEEEARKYYRETICLDYNLKKKADNINYAGYCYKEILKHNILASEYFKVAAQLRSSPAYYNLGLDYYFGITFKQDYRKALECFKESYKIVNNYTDARHAVAICYQKINDYESMYQYIYDQKENRFYELLGDYYCYSNNRDYEKAKHYYQLIVNDMPIGYYKLAMIERKTKVYNEQYFYLQKAIDNGYNYAYLALGQAYVNGWGVKKNYSKAKECFEKHLEFYPNDDNSLCELGELYVNGYGIEQDYQEAYKWFMKSYEKENGSAAYELSKMYFNGYFVEKDIEKGLEYLQIALDKNISQAHLYKVSLLLEGNILDKDIDAAKELIYNALENNDNQEILSNYIEYVKNGTLANDLEDVYTAYEFVRDIYKEKNYIKKEFFDIKYYYEQKFYESLADYSTYKDSICKDNDEVFACYFEKDDKKLVFIDPFTLFKYESLEDGAFPPFLEPGELLSLVLIDGKALYADYVKPSDFQVKNPAASRIKTCKWHLSTVNKEPAFLCEEASDLLQTNINKAFAFYRCAAIQGYCIGYYGMGHAYLMKKNEEMAKYMYRKAILSSEMKQFPNLFTRVICQYLALMQKHVAGLPDKNSFENSEFALRFIENTMIYNSGLYQSYQNYKKNPNIDSVLNIRVGLITNNFKDTITVNELTPIRLAVDCYEATLWMQLHEQGDKRACYNLASFFRDKNYYKMIEWYNVALERGDAEAHYLAAHYPEDFGLENDEAERRYHLGIAANKGYTHAKFELKSRADDIKHQLNILESIIEDDKLSTREGRDRAGQAIKNIKYDANIGKMHE